MSIKQDALSRIEELNNKDWDVEINAIMTPPVNLDDPEVNELEEELDIPIIYDEDVTYFKIAFYEPESGLAVPTPEELRELVQHVELAGGGNIVHGDMDLFGEVSRKFYDLNDEKMEEEDVNFEGDREILYGGEGKARIETLRFQTRVEGDPDDFNEDDLREEAKEDLLSQAKQAIYNEEHIQEIKVNEKPPTEDEDELEEMDWHPNRVKIGELIQEFDKIVIPSEEDPEEEPEIDNIDVGDIKERNLNKKNEEN